MRTTYSFLYEDIGFEPWPGFARIVQNVGTPVSALALPTGTATSKTICEYKVSVL